MKKPNFETKTARYTVLIAEDNLMLRKALVEAAAAKNMNVVEAVDGSEALVKSQNQQFDGILIDMNLPKRLGHEVIHMVRKESPSQDAVIVVLSGYLKKEVVEAIAGKVNKAFTKPADIEEVINTFHDLIQKKGPAQAA